MLQMLIDYNSSRSSTIESSHTFQNKNHMRRIIATRSIVDVSI